MSAWPGFRHVINGAVFGFYNAVNIVKVGQWSPTLEWEEVVVGYREWDAITVCPGNDSGDHPHIIKITLITYLNKIVRMKNKNDYKIFNILMINYMYDKQLIEIF